MEANIVRPFVTRALQTFYKLSSPEMIQDSGSVSDRQPQTTDRGPRVSILFHFLLLLHFWFVQLSIQEAQKHFYTC